MRGRRRKGVTGNGERKLIRREGIETVAGGWKDGEHTRREVERRVNDG